MGEATQICPSCGNGFEPPAPCGEAAHPEEASFRCPQCAAPTPAASPNVSSVSVAAMASSAPTLAPPPASSSTGSCPYCFSGIGREEAVEVCSGCAAKYHRECWDENGGCAVYGCSKMPVAEPRRAIEVPYSYWGRENKPCPACRKEILAAAVRCRHCGATFASARPQGQEEFYSQSALEERLPEAKKRIVTIFVVSILPFTAPIGAVWGFLWKRDNREEIAALPALYGALVKIGFVAAVFQTAALFVMSLTYFLVAAG